MGDIYFVPKPGVYHRTSRLHPKTFSLKTNVARAMLLSFFAKLGKMLEPDA